MFTELIRTFLDYANLAGSREEKLRRMLEGVVWFREEAIHFHDDPHLVLAEMQSLHDEVIQAAAQGGEAGELLKHLAGEMIDRGWVSARDIPKAT